MIYCSGDHTILIHRKDVKREVKGMKGKKTCEIANQLGNTAKKHVLTLEYIVITLLCVSSRAIEIGFKT